MIRVDTGDEDESTIRIRSTSYTISKANRLGSASKVLRIKASASNVDRSEAALMEDAPAEWNSDFASENSTLPLLSDDDPAYLEYLAETFIVPQRPRVHVSKS